MTMTLSLYELQRKLIGTFLAGKLQCPKALRRLLADVVSRAGWRTGHRNFLSKKIQFCPRETAMKSAIRLSRVRQGVEMVPLKHPVNQLVPSPTIRSSLQALATGPF